MSYGAEEFLALMHNWMKDARFHHLVRYGQERHWLSATGLRETNHSDILAWLLDPSEGHGLGDFFLRRLLVEATTADDNAKEVNHLIDRGLWPPLVELFADGLHGFQVGREVPCGDVTIANRVEKGYLDLLLIDCKRKLAVLIERKASRLAHEQQLKKYEAWLEVNLKKYQVLRVVSDTGLIDQAIARERSWLVVDDDWLLDGLRAAIKQNRASDIVCRRLADYLATVQWSEDSDCFYSGIESDLDLFAAEHSKEIKDLRKMHLLDIPVRRLNVRSLMGTLIPNLSRRKIHGARKLAIEQAGELASRYSAVIEAVLDRNLYSTLEADVEKNHPGEFAFWHRRLRSGEQEMWITSKIYEERKQWPLVLEVQQVETTNDELADRPEPIAKTRIRLKLHSNAFESDDTELDAPTAVLQVFNRQKTSHENVTLRRAMLKKETLVAKDLAEWLEDLKRVTKAATAGLTIMGRG
ncbi:PD-(D/E)XK nuclease family protein [Acidovorax sp. PRC11]|uniref:PD-(D/E)XK nuclease family protein n=1 Tax=Acidovorax sp. PRC11 TaxID=2962592 RepID=UPI00288264A7|nr:PD-(D/E)XK nuclease family protein [Acidovorax sp. PRC11]MDT0139092.1 PD-(D/E)XK nuclease family protein [Acidovorax sp. PRC11]